MTVEEIEAAQYKPACEEERQEVRDREDDDSEEERRKFLCCVVSDARTSRLPLLRQDSQMTAYLRIGHRHIA